MFCGGSKSAKGGPNPLADMDRGGPNPLADLDRGVQIRCDTGNPLLLANLRKANRKSRTFSPCVNSR